MPPPRPEHRDGTNVPRQQLRQRPPHRHPLLPQKTPRHNPPVGTMQNSCVQREGKIMKHPRTLLELAKACCTPAKHKKFIRWTLKTVESEQSEPRRTSRPRREEGGANPPLGIQTNEAKQSSEVGKNE